MKIEIGDVFVYKSKTSIDWFKKNETTIYFKEGDKFLILNENEIKRYLYEYTAFHFKKGIIKFLFMKSLFEDYFDKVC